MSEGRSSRARSAMPAGDSEASSRFPARPSGLATYRINRRATSTTAATAEPKTRAMPATTPAGEASGQIFAGPPVRNVPNVARVNGGVCQPEPVSAAPTVPPSHTPPNSTRLAAATSTMAHGAISLP